MPTYGHFILLECCCLYFFLGKKIVKVFFVETVIVGNGTSSGGMKTLICDTLTGSFFDSHTRACASSDTTELSNIMTLSNLEELVNAGERGLPKDWRCKILPYSGFHCISPSGVLYQSVSQALIAAKITQLATMRKVLAELTGMMRCSDKELIDKWHQACPTFGAREAKDSFWLRAKKGTAKLNVNHSTSLLKFFASAFSQMTTLSRMTQILLQWCIV